MTTMTLFLSCGDRGGRAIVRSEEETKDQARGAVKRRAARRTGSTASRNEVVPTGFVRRNFTPNEPPDGPSVGLYQADDGAGHRAPKAPVECPLCFGAMKFVVNNELTRIARIGIELGPMVDGTQPVAVSAVPFGASVYGCKSCDVVFTSLAESR